MKSQCRAENEGSSPGVHLPVDAQDTVAAGSGTALLWTTSTALLRQTDRQTGRSSLLSDSPWMFLQFCFLAWHLSIRISLMDMLYKHYNAVDQASLSLGHFVQPSLSLLSTITVCNMNLVKRNLQWFKYLPFTLLSHRLVLRTSLKHQCTI